MIAQPLHHIINAFEREVPRQRNGRDVNPFQAEGALTGGAVKVYVQVVYIAVALIAANGIF